MTNVLSTSAPPPETADLAIEAHGLEKSFGPTRALAGLDLAVQTGTILGVLGPNGSGEDDNGASSHHLAPTGPGGQRAVAGYDVVTEATQVRRRIGLAGQSAALDESLTGSGNLVMIGQLNRLPRRQAQHRAEELLSRFGLAEAGDRGGQDVFRRYAPPVGPGSQPGDQP